MKKLIIVLLLVMLSGCSSVFSKLEIIPYTNETLNSYVCSLYNHNWFDADYTYSVDGDKKSIFVNDMLFYFSDNSFTATVNGTTYHATDTIQRVNFDPFDASNCAGVITNQAMLSAFHRVEKTNEFLNDSSTIGYWSKISVDDDGMIKTYRSYNSKDELLTEITNINTTSITIPQGEEVHTIDFVMLFHPEFEYTIDQNNAVLSYNDWQVTIVPTEYVDYVKGDEHYRFYPGHGYMDDIASGERFLYPEITEHTDSLTPFMISTFRDIYDELYDPMFVTLSNV